MVALRNTINSITLAILDTDKWTDGSHRTHRRNHRLVFSYLSLMDILLVFHHLVAVLSSRFARGYASNILRNSHVEVLLLLLIDLAPLNSLGRHRGVGRLLHLARLTHDRLRLRTRKLVGRVRRLDPPVVVLEILLRHAALNPLIRLIGNVGALIRVRVNGFGRAAAFDPVFGLLHGGDFLVDRLAHGVALVLHLLAFGVDGVARAHGPYGAHRSRSHVSALRGCVRSARSLRGPHLLGMSIGFPLRSLYSGRSIPLIR